MEAFDMKKKMLTVLLCLIFVAMSCLFVACDEVEQQEETFPYVRSTLGKDTYRFGQTIEDQDEYFEVIDHYILGEAKVIDKFVVNGKYPLVLSGTSKVIEEIELPKYEVVIWEYEKTINAPIYMSEQIILTKLGKVANPDYFEYGGYAFEDGYFTLGEAFSNAKPKVTMENIPYLHVDSTINNIYMQIDSVKAVVNQEITDTLIEKLGQAKPIYVGGASRRTPLAENQYAIAYREARANINVVVIQVYEINYNVNTEKNDGKKHNTYEFATKTIIDNYASWTTHDQIYPRPDKPVEIIITINEDGTYTVTNPHQEYQGGLFV